MIKNEIQRTEGIEDLSFPSPDRTSQVSTSSSFYSQDDFGSLSAPVEFESREGLNRSDFHNAFAGRVEKLAIVPGSDILVAVTNDESPSFSIWALPGSKVTSVGNTPAPSPIEIISIDGHIEHIAASKSGRYWAISTGDSLGVYAVSGDGKSGQLRAVLGLNINQGEVSNVGFTESEDLIVGRSEGGSTVIELGPNNRKAA